MTPGGDGTLIAPSFTFEKYPWVKLKGPVKEVGKLITKTLEGIDGKVNMYAGKVDYIQDVEFTGKATIKGTHEYQVCNDKMCLPPKDKNFSIQIGK
jgi:thiol:disulfide interchange protein DsbD